MTEERPERAAIPGTRQNWDALGAVLPAAKFVSSDHMWDGDTHMSSPSLFQVGGCDYADLIPTGW
jgi:hypothetical protein